MAKLRPIFKQGSDVVLAYMFGCPGCGGSHVIDVNNSNPKCNWTFNGDLIRPTFSPSLLCRGQHFPSGGEWPSDDEYKLMMRREEVKMVPYVCHSFIRNGQIQFLDDCTHNLKGQTVDLPNIP